MPLTFKEIQQGVNNKQYLSLKNRQYTDEDIEIICEYLKVHTDITSLDLSGTPISEKGIKLLAKNTTLQELLLSHTGLTDEGAEALAQNTTLVSLALYVNKIGDKGAIALGANQNFIELHLAHNQIGDIGAQALAKSKTLRALNLSYNKIEQKGIQALRNNKNFQKLELRGNNIPLDLYQLEASTNNKGELLLSGAHITDEDMPVLCDYLKAHTEIKYLDLSSNWITDAGVKILAQNTTLEALSLSHNQLTDEAAEVLAVNTTIAHLDLRINRIGNRGATALAKNQHLIELRLANNRVGDEGAQAFGRNQTLEGLDLAHNQIGPEGVKDLKANKKLQHLILLANNIRLDVDQLKEYRVQNRLVLSNARLEDEDIPNICKYLQQNPHITELDLSGNNITDNGVKLLVKVTALQVLSLSHNKITDEGAEVLAQSTSLRSLALFVNKIGDKGAKALAANPNFTSLNLAYNQIGVEGLQALEQNERLRSLVMTHQKIPEAVLPSDPKENKPDLEVNESAEKDTQDLSNNEDPQPPHNPEPAKEEPNQEPYAALIKKLKPLTLDYLNYLQAIDKPSNKELWEQKIEHVLGLWNTLQKENIASSIRVGLFYDQLNQAETQIKEHRDPDWMRYVKNTLICAGILLTGILPGLIALALYVNTGTTVGKSFQFWHSRGERVVEQLKDMQNSESATSQNQMG